MIENYSLCLNEFRKNLAANLAQRFPGYCYASAGDQSTFADMDVAGGAPSVRRPGARAMQRSGVSEQFAAFALFPLVFVPFMQYAA